MDNQNRFTHWFIRLLAGLVLSSSLIHVSAQSPDQSTPDANTKNKSEIIRCPVYITVVKVKVSDQAGKEVSELTKDDFSVYEDGVKQQIVFWTSDGDTDAARIQPGYVMAYYPVNRSFEGKFRRIRVVVRAKGRAKLKAEFTPKGYYAKKELLK